MSSFLAKDTPKKPLIVVISAPAGTGKTTLAEKLCSDWKTHVEEVVSYTTRPRRKNEQEGVHYHFISEEAFVKFEKDGDFVETAEIYGFSYGTKKKDLEAILAKRKHALLVIDTQGAKQIRQKLPDAVFVFLAPPSLLELERRLLHRERDEKEEIEKRLAWAEHELEEADQYDYFIINDSIDDAYLILQSILIAEQFKNI